MLLLVRSLASCMSLPSRDRRSVGRVMLDRRWRLLWELLEAVVC